ncbi:MAG: type III-A CRISPR-associated RAMP protein Csm3 [Lachnospiraceae bacterium]|nr:type III-A CRISPR-associated RAMP protein Csm3 [Lachnospiraceae bacterium]
MFAKINITGTITSKTGMHIGGASGFSAIGAIDSSVIRDIRTDLPMIPGSSFKGKMRSLLARQYSEGALPKKPGDDVMRVRRLFGYMEDGKGSDKKAHTARLQFSDMFLKNSDELKRIGVPVTEVKFENTINRLTAVANPRQIERSVAGAQYGLDLIYSVEKEEEMVEDFETIRDGLILLSYDYLGGSGSRGYGRVEFSDLEINCVIGDCSDDTLKRCSEILGEVVS